MAIASVLTLVHKALNKLILFPRRSHTKVARRLHECRKRASGFEGAPHAMRQTFLSCLAPGGAGARGCTTNKPLIARDGKILCGGSLEDGYWRAFVDASADGGATWQATRPLDVKARGTIKRPEKKVRSALQIVSRVGFGERG
jgi:hypothetical protein